MSKITKSPDEWVVEIENAISSGNAREVAKLKNSLSKISNPQQLYQSVYLRGRQALIRNDDVVAEGLLYWLETLVKGNWQAHLAAAELRQKKQGVEEANRSFREYVKKYPIYRYQTTNEKNKITCAILLTLGSELTKFKDGGFTLPSGLTENQHLIENKCFDASMIFVESLKDIKILSNFDIIINALSDTDLYFDHLKRLLNQLSASSIPIINTPEATIKNTRSLLSEKIASTEQYIFPRTIRLSLNGVGDHEVMDHIKALGLRFPVLFRPVGTHTGHGMIKIDTEQDSILSITPGDYYLSEFYDFRSPDGYYRKYRFWNIGDKIVHNHVFIGTGWNVHATSRIITMLPNPMFLEEDASYVKHGLPDLNQNLQSIAQSIREITNLDYFGVDYGITPNGIPVVFEANATMRSYYPEISDTFPHSKIALDKHVAAFQAFVKEKIVRG